jgi:hypothetical protein
MGTKKRRKIKSLFLSLKNAPQIPKFPKLKMCHLLSSNQYLSLLNPSQFK